MAEAKRPDWAEVATSQLLSDAADRADGSQRPAMASWLRLVVNEGTDEQKTAAIGVAEIIMGEKA
jgi:hypothetical protein